MKLLTLKRNACPLFFFKALFLGCLFIGGLINLLISILIKRMKIVAPDRILGSFFGFARGLFITSLLVLLIEPTPLSSLPTWSNSSLVPQVKNISELIKSMIPQDLLNKMGFEKMMETAKDKALDSAISLPKANQ